MQKLSIYDPALRKSIKLESLVEEGWRKFDIEKNIVKLRQISTVFCHDFKLVECFIYVVDILDENVDGIYYPSANERNLNPKILLLKGKANIMTFFHELTHHLQSLYYGKYGQDHHGYTFTLAKLRVARWATKNVMKIHPCVLNERSY